MNQPARVVRFESPTAERLADTISSLADLQFAIDASDRLSQLLASADGDGDPDSLLVRALWDSAIVAYARCFIGGVRAKVALQARDEIETPGAHEVHQLYIDLRNKHVGHAVNAFEDVGVGLVLIPDPTSPGLLGTADLSRRLISHDTAGVDQFRRLATEVRERLAEREPELRAAVEGEARSRGLDDLYSLSPLRSEIPGPDAASRRR